MVVPVEPKDGAIASKSILPFPRMEGVVLKARNGVMDGVFPNHRISFIIRSGTNDSRALRVIKEKIRRNYGQ
ncbi:MAG: hypothetical protein WD016_05630 [Balneolaceae bacterium]